MKFVKFLRTHILKNICERLLLCFHFNSHHHYRYHHLHYHCKMHLYCLRIFLTIPLDCNVIPCLFPLNFFVFLLVYDFLWSYSKFSVFMIIKSIQNWFKTIRQILDALFILIFISAVIYTSLIFTLTCLYLLTFIYLCFLCSVIYTII